VKSQHGALVGVASAADVEKTTPLAFSPLDWATHASRRVVTSTFAAETSAALEAVGRGMYVRSLMAEIIHGPVCRPHEWTEQHLAVVVVTDCKSLYDNIQKECSLCDDRHTALYICGLRQLLSAGPQRDLTRARLLWVPSRHQLADGLTKSGLGDMMRGALQAGTAQLHEVSQQELKRRAQADRGRS